ncbi:GTP binding [Balamuthia mandrillaris]
MGAWITKVMNMFAPKNGEEARLLMVGLDAAGKTTILYKLKYGVEQMFRNDIVVTTTPTVGFNVEILTYNNVKFTVWDLGGQKRIRYMWRHYLENTQGLIFVIDSADQDRFLNNPKCPEGSVSEELNNLLQEDALEGVPLLIFANKQDLENAVNPAQLANVLQLYSILDQEHEKEKLDEEGEGENSNKKERSKPRQRREWKVQQAIAKDAEGLREGLEWLAEVMKKRREASEGRKRGQGVLQKLRKVSYPTLSSFSSSSSSSSPSSSPSTSSSSEGSTSDDNSSKSVSSGSSSSSSSKLEAGKAGTQ